MTPLIDPLNHGPPAPEAPLSNPPPEEPTVPYQPPSRDELHQDWPLDPNARAPIVAGLIAMSQRGATKTYINEDGETVTVKVKPRESLRAMRTLNALGRMSLRQQKRDRQAKVHNGQKTLNDLVSPANSVAGETRSLSVFWPLCTLAWRSRFCCRKDMRPRALSVRMARSDSRGLTLTVTVSPSSLI